MDSMVADHVAEWKNLSGAKMFYLILDCAINSILPLPNGECGFTHDR